MPQMEEAVVHAVREKEKEAKTKKGWTPHPDFSEMICCVIECVTSQVPGYQQHRSFG